MSRTIILFVGLVVFSSPLYSQKDHGLQFILEEKGYEGVIVLHDLNNDKTFFSHNNLSSKRVLPASTFKIFHTLFFLENKVVPDTNYILKWDGTEHLHLGNKVPSWYKDTSLAEAFRNSTVWYYATLSKSFPLKYYKKALKKNRYGRISTWNKKELDFWNTGSKIGVSANDQIKLLKRLYQNRLKFKKEHMEAVKELMVEKRTDKYILRSKTGWTVAALSKFEEEIHIGWNVGYIEYEGNVYFFAVRLEQPVDRSIENFAADRKLITNKALKHSYNLDI